MKAAQFLMLAYARGEVSQGSIDWDDLDLAFEEVYREHPGEYRKMVKRLEAEADDPANSAA